MTENIIIPALGGTGDDVVVEEWLVHEGEVVRPGQVLFTVASEKAVVEVEAFRSGRIEKILAPGGTTVAIGETVALIGDAAEVPAAQTMKPTPSQEGTKRNSSPAALRGALTSHSRPLEGGAPRRHSLDSRGGKPAPSTDSAAPVWTPKKPSADGLLEAYRKMVLIRRFEDHLYQLFLQGLVPGTLHQYQGQEAVAVGVCSALRTDDVIFSTHRPVGHFLAKGCSARSIAAELWGKATGCAGGKGGQMHLCDMTVGAPPSNAIVGANLPIATGAALGFKLRGLDRVAVSFFGDGGANIGAAHEALNLAAVKDAPVIFVCENNLYGASTHQSLATRVVNIADRAAGYGMPGVVVDGMDVTAVYRAAAQAVRRARHRQGPTLLECKTYRYAGHSRGDPGGYRTKDEIAHWKARDPIPHCRALLTDQHGVDAGRLDEVERQCQAEVEEAVRFAQASPDPAPESLYQNVFAERKVRA